MVDAQQMQDGRVQIMDRADAFHRMVPVLVRGSVDGAGLDSAAGQPEAEAERIVVPAVRALDERSAAEFARKDHQRFVEQAPALEILQQAGHRLVDGVGVPAVPHDQVLVLIPRIRRIAPAAVAAIDHGQFDEPHAALDEAARDEALQGVIALGRKRRVQAVEFAGRLGLAADVDQLRHGRLHVVGRLVVLDGRFDLRVARGAVEVHRIEVADEIQAAALLRVLFPRPDVGERFLRARVEHRSLVFGGQETVAEHVDAAERDASGADHDEARQFPGLAAQAVVHPSPHGGKARKRLAAVEIEVALGMLHEFRRHRADDGDVVDLGRDVREQVADRRAGFAVEMEVPRGRHDVAVLVEHRPSRLERHGLAGFGGQARFRVERVDMRQAARHVAEDDALDLRLKVGAGSGRGIRQARVRGVGHQPGQGQQAESGGSRAQHFPPR